MNGSPFGALAEPVFIESRFDEQYRVGGDERTLTLIGYFTFLSILISMLGLFGLSSFMNDKDRRPLSFPEQILLFRIFHEFGNPSVADRFRSQPSSDDFFDHFSGIQHHVHINSSINAHFIHHDHHILSTDKPDF